MSIGAGPFTIVGVPIPPKWKDYVAADLLNISIGGSGSPNISGNYAACEDITAWAGSGELKADVELSCSAKAKVPEVVVVQGEISGSTDITESLSVIGNDLTVTTNWGGLTAKGVIVLSLSTFLFEDTFKFEVNKTYFAKNGVSPIKIPLPSLRE